MESSNTQPDKVNIIETTKVIDAKYAHLDGSTFVMLKMSNASFNDVDLSKLKITNANLSDLEIEGAQLGGAYIHNIGMPPEGHPAYNPAAKQRPLRFDDCELSHSTINNCNLQGVAITNCNITGMTINGILIEDLLNGRV
ncbi:pentapeptide repeat-containing protein [Mucilaginibacter ginsenosidivorax]|uniref:Pentapeptide repeat-containing protein n=1 Tax=Mucilaginibacter ginsenosidivorax TaxID=862126 RepID=A0A5B8W143_9SPHI|nr:pentapeptide repeat-containing protein [Mucilaginibacter ginsenosidivorax]QEC75958.1 pentapeptide repeat-containing protein [Mucilaginibacter ginsenosidivorax]